MAANGFHHILVVRTDRIGDVVLSLPMVTVLRRNFPSARIDMLLRSYTKELAEGYPGLNRTLTYDDDGKPRPFFEVLKELRSAPYDLAVVAFPRVRIALLLFLAGIRVRVGTGYRWYSFLFNHRVYEHRKTAEKHELEYNLSLLRSVGCEYESSPEFSLAIPSNAVEKSREVKRELGILDSDELAVLHPGSGGSARDWSPVNFAKLASGLSKRGMKVVVTGGPGEERLVDKVVEGAGNEVSPLVNRFTLIELAAFVKDADLFVSNSTGPLHIAVAVGTPVIGFFPPIRACSRERWGPYTSKKIVFVPNAAECARCKGGSCKGNDCMDLIRVEDVLEAVSRLRSSAETTHTASAR